jgi:hypothetical protein
MSNASATVIVGRNDAVVEVTMLYSAPSPRIPTQALAAGRARDGHSGDMAQ